MFHKNNSNKRFLHSPVRSSAGSVSAARSARSSGFHFAVPLLACLAGTLGRISPDAPLSHDWPESRDSDTNRVRALELACGAHQLLGTAMGSAGSKQLLEYFSGSSSRPLLNGLGSSNATRRGAFYCNSAVCVASSTMGFANDTRAFEDF
jgi:hypothetical protein